MSNQPTHNVYASLAGAIRNPAGQSAEELRAEVRREWEAAGQVRDDHGFLTMRRIRPYSARQAGKHLMVPMFDEAGALCGLFTIEPNSRTEFMGDLSQPGVRVQLLPEASRRSQSTIVCTDWPDACAIHAATGEPVLCAITAENAAHVAREVRALHPDRQILLAHDEGDGASGLLAAVAHEIGGTLLSPHYTIVDRADSFLALHMRHGPQALRTVIGEAGEPATHDVDVHVLGDQLAHQPGSKVERAKALLNRLLTPSCTTKRLKAEAAMEGISWRVMEEARAQLVEGGAIVRPTRQGAGWAWVLDDATPTPQEPLEMRT